MLYLNEDAKVVFYNKPVNLHKGFDSLAYIARIELGFDLTTNLYFLFRNLRRDRIKILYMDGQHLSLLSMRFAKTLKFSSKEVVTFDRKSFAEFLSDTISRGPVSKYKISEN